MSFTAPAGIFAVTSGDVGLSASGPNLTFGAGGGVFECYYGDFVLSPLSPYWFEIEPPEHVWE